MAVLLRLRIVALRRLVTDAFRDEPATAVLVGLCLCVGVWWLVRSAGTASVAQNTPIVAIFVVLLVHTSRRDERFLRLSGHRPAAVFAAEYLALTAPAVLLLVLGGHAREALVVVAAGPLVTFIPAGLAVRTAGWRAAGRPWLTLPPATPFEWLSGVRRSWPVLLSLYLGAIALSGVAAGAVAFLVAITWVVCGFHRDFEGWPMVQAYALPAGAFLRRKVGDALRAWGLLISPLLLVCLVRQPGHWGVLLAGTAGCALVVAGRVLAKYAAYRSGGALGAFGSLIPVVLTVAVVLLPVGAYLLYRLGRMATANLQRWLYAVA